MYTFHLGDQPADPRRCPAAKLTDRQMKVLTDMWAEPYQRARSFRLVSGQDHHAPSRPEVGGLRMLQCFATEKQEWMRGFFNTYIISELVEPEWVWQCVSRHNRLLLPCLAGSPRFTFWENVKRLYCTLGRWYLPLLVGNYSLPPQLAFPGTLRRCTQKTQPWHWCQRPILVWIKSIYWKTFCEVVSYISYDLEVVTFCTQLSKWCPNIWYKSEAFYLGPFLLQIILPQPKFLSFPLTHCEHIPTTPDWSEFDWKREETDKGFQSDGKTTRLPTNQWSSIVDIRGRARVRGAWRSEPPPFFPWIYNSENYTRFLESDLEYQIKASERKGFTV